MSRKGHPVPPGIEGKNAGRTWDEAIEVCVTWHGRKNAEKCGTWESG